jgi:hypothetical protein
MNDVLVALAEASQRRHAELIAEASRRTSTEARVEVRNELDALRRDFTEHAMALTGVWAPMQWLPENPDHAVAIAVMRDIADTEAQLARLANGEAFNKILSKDLRAGFHNYDSFGVVSGLMGRDTDKPGGEGGGPPRPGPLLGAAAAAVVILLAIFLAKR